MKRVLVIAALASAALAAADRACAQPRVEEEPTYMRLPHRFQIFVELAGAIPYQPGTFNDYWEPSFQFGLGGGMSIFPWLEVNAGFATGSFNNNSIETKGKIGYVGVEDVEGGEISVTSYYGSARFIALPRTRTNPYAEFAVGYYSTSAEPLVIETVLVNEMESASGMLVAPSFGIQHALNDRWSAYTKFTYQLNLSDTFASGELLRPVGDTEEIPGDNQVVQAFTVGVLVRF